MAFTDIAIIHGKSAARAVYLKFNIGAVLEAGHHDLDVAEDVDLALDHLAANLALRIALEDESANIGSVHIPHALYERMRQSPGVVLEAPVETRVDITLKEYISDMLVQFSAHEGGPEQGFSALTDYLHNSLYRVRRRLGGKAY